MTNDQQGVLNAGNSHVASAPTFGGIGRFDEGEIASVKPRRGSLLYNMFRFVFCVGLTCVWCAGVFADDVRWNGGGGTAAWSDGDNWDGGVAPGEGDTAVIPQGKTAIWAQTDAAFMNALSGIELNGEMEVSGMTAETSLTVPLSGNGVFRGLEGGEKATGVSSGTYYYLTLNNNNSNFTGTFAFTNCGVCVNNNLALGNATTRCTLHWKNDTSGNHVVCISKPRVHIRRTCIFRSRLTEQV